MPTPGPINGALGAEAPSLTTGVLPLPQVHGGNVLIRRGLLGLECQPGTRERGQVRVRHLGATRFEPVPWSRGSQTVIPRPAVLATC